MQGVPHASPSSAADGVELARSLMRGFAERTGLGGEGLPRRYLWTDAFAVCNFLALERATGDGSYRHLALALVDQVHHVLGRHRPDDPRRGWISGLPEAEGEEHPTRGGLRIGKRLPEREPGAPFDERLEWERDGQYFHYLTRWVHALDQLARATREPRYNAWARELLDVAWRAFTRGDSRRGGRMCWKMSIDLSRPLVASMGQHDPLDGFVSCVELRATADSLPGGPREPRLDAALAGFASLLSAERLATADPLGIGGLLVDAGRVAQLLRREPLRDGRLLEALLLAAWQGLHHYVAGDPLGAPSSRRLAFRELGLAIGLAALPAVGEALGVRGEGTGGVLRARLEALAPHAALGPAIAAFWCDPSRRSEALWTEHADIDDVMLASALVPDGVLVLHGLPSELPPR